ncbi:MAG: DUF1573 domain-containing protein [Bacteroidota bacterium]|nr:DUF1573 domain-containing protein [Bacteroidota bacterium]MDP4233598.1 DUF1573 domain-containing protein [Bacteroidota bacterium]MDP4244091.1 DUF1573 domain-containing protein [Bacteroidota bacterium]MDP4288526.1 DUF1573 domain-containing protein [Bacteroidota bacterium]
MVKVLSTLLVLTLLVAGYSLFNHSKASGHAATDVKIAVDSADVDLGKLEQGDSVGYTYQIHNSGSDTLRISAVKPSCGCTDARLSTHIIPPSCSASLKVLFSSVGKELGPYAKTVSLISNATPNQEILRFHGLIVMPSRPHNAAMSIQNIFSGRCAECHVNRGRGQLGKTLYAADCAICHGARAEGKPASDLVTSQKELGETYLFRTILDGKHGTNMPAFDWQKGGPLTAQEIKTLCQYIRIERSNRYSMK